MLAGIIGHQRPKRFLDRALTGGRLPHAYLFTGPEGIGKATVARALAASLFCREGVEAVPCGHCPFCRQFASANHPDFIHIVPDGAAIKIDQIREIKRQLAFAPLSARTRIILIEEAQTMRREAGNSLLKILEEPPPDNLFLVVASDAQPILPTIVSRCQVLSFSPLTKEEAVQVILAHAPETGRERAGLLARITEGAPGQALAMKDGQCLEIFSQIITALTKKECPASSLIEEVLYLAEGMAAAREELGLVFDLLKMLCKELSVALLTGRDISLLAAREAKERERLRERWNLPQLSDKIHAIDRARQALARNCNRALVCEVLLLDLLLDPVPDCNHRHK
jgi:DNA polymerase-3 subunit delta'